MGGVSDGGGYWDRTSDPFGVNADWPSPVTGRAVGGMGYIFDVKPSAVV